jgi:two-component system chemotaxis response regulator CheB
MSAGSASSLVRVLVVDDSAYVRKVVKQMLSRSPFIDVVGMARDGREALELVEELKPDVVTLDLVMPGMDGIEFLEKQMARKPLPVVIVSISGERSELVVKALNLGAIDFVQKPSALATERMFEMSDLLVEKVKEAAGVALRNVAVPDQPPAVKEWTAGGPRVVDMVVIGVSTGGPQALRYLIPQFGANFPVPVAVVIHMPIGYTEMYAESLSAISQIPVAEATEGRPIRQGEVVIAPAGRHLTFLRRDGEVLAHLDARPLDTPHRPAVDVLFRSAAEIYQSRVLGVVMTGMGTDGKEGAAWIKSKGGLIFTEAEESCVVYGMPRAVEEAGLSDRSIPLTRLTQAILELI